MQKRSTRVQASLLAVAIALLAGCASQPTISLDQLNDPATTPKEKWSEALTYLEAMGVTGMRDIPREVMDDLQRSSAQGAYSAGALDVGMAGLGIASGPSSIGGGAALGVGVGLMLIGGGASPMVDMIHVAAWVPFDLAGSPEEAVKVVDHEYNMARKRVFKRVYLTKRR